MRRPLQAATALPGPRGKIDLPLLMQWLAGAGVNELQVEAGATLNAALAELGSLEQALRFDFTEVVRVGDDLRLMARPREPSTRRFTPGPS